MLLVLQKIVGCKQVFSVPKTKEDPTALKMFEGIIFKLMLISVFEIYLLYAKVKLKICY